MRFQFIQIELLPCLAWCAVLEKNEDVICIWHGSSIETGEDFFVEGAWDGPFESREFDNAITFTGSGGRLTGEHVLFATPTHNLERLFSIRTSCRLFISNSMAFLLARANDNLDINYPNYYFDILRYYRCGLTITNRTLITATGNQVHLHDCMNFMVGPELDIVINRKRFGNPPKEYQAYVDFLEKTVAKVAENAMHPSRKIRYPMVTSISRGYDSTAVSVLASRCGCREAVTFLSGGDRAGNYVADDGGNIARQLGMNVTEFERKDIRTFDYGGPAEQYTNIFFITERHMPVMTSKIQGTLFLSGRHGEHFWDVDPIRSLPWFQEYASLSNSGSNSTEIRLRIGYLHFPVPYTLGVHAPALYRVSHSKEMAPWKIGGNYDRPIPRRLVESAGIPRDWFGQIKIGGVGNSMEDRILPPHWEHDFISFYETRVDPKIRATLVNDQIGPVGYYEKGKASDWQRWLYTRPIIRRSLSGTFYNKRHHMWRSRYLYTFHWGFEYTMQRYLNIDAPTSTNT
ncbi:MAG: hypothetical protein DHS20C01_34160 [marine bacterium B5-7]|nr:MAG: hypothetical protein DHS20C01_34160 [marine bacterium B5-7]